MSLRVMRSPGVYENEVDFSDYVNTNVSPTTVALVGSSIRGKVGSQYFSNDTALLRKNGEPRPTDMSMHAGLRYLKSGNNLHFARVVPEDAETAEATLSLTTPLINTGRNRLYDRNGNEHLPQTMELKSTGWSITSKGNNPINFAIQSSTNDNIVLKADASLYKKNPVNSYLAPVANATDLKDNFTLSFGASTVSLSAATYNTVEKTISCQFNGTVNVGNTFGWNNTYTDSSNIASGTLEVFKIEMLGPGADGNNFMVRTSDSESGANGIKTEGDFTCEVYYKDELVESYKANILGNTLNYIENIVRGSDFIKLEDLTEGQLTVMKSAGVTLAGGENGSTITAAEMIGTTDILGNKTGISQFSDKEAFEIDLLAAPGWTERPVVISEIELAANRGDCITVLDTPAYLTASDAVDWHNGAGSYASQTASAFNSSFGAMYWPWLYEYDAYSRKELLMPPSVFVVECFNKSIKATNMWTAPAGFKRGIITGALGSERPVPQGDRDLLYSFGNCINPIVKFAKDGLVIMGQKTLQRRSSALDRVNVRLLTNYLKRIITASTRFTLFENITEGTMSDWVAMVDPVLEEIKKAGGMYDYLVLMDRTTVSDLDIDNNRMPGKILYKPVKTAEFIPLDYVLTRTGASFTDYI